MSEQERTPEEILEAQEIEWRADEERFGRVEKANRELYCPLCGDKNGWEEVIADCVTLGDLDYFLQHECCRGRVMAIPMPEDDPAEWEIRIYKETRSEATTG